MSTSTDLPLPGGVGVSRLCVYDRSGTPHMHLCCSEAYVVLAGAGAVQTLTWDGFAETPLRPGAVVWFAPGTIHRLVNGGGLEMVVLMQNSGLPEAGDAVLTFAPEVLADPDRYAGAVTLPDGGAPGSDLAAPHARREAALAGFAALREGGRDALDAFHRAAAALVTPKVPQWRERWENGALAAALATGAQFDALERGDLGHLRSGVVRALDAPSEEGRRGMCGLLNTYHVR